jgi:hypothetical protein
MGGVTPSGPYLIHMFCREIERLRKLLDAECIKRLATSLFVDRCIIQGTFLGSFAAKVSLKCYCFSLLYRVFQVPKWMMKWGGTKLFEVLESGLNKYGEIIVQPFESSDNHRQLRHVLQMLHDQGLSPSIVFSDVPSCDRRLLETIFPTLDKGVHEMDIAVNNDERFEMLPLRGKILYEDNLESARASLQILSEALDEAPANEKVVSFDPEWPVFDGGKRKGAISVISLASPVTDDVILIHIAWISSSNTLLHQLKSLFSHSDVVFVGRMIKNDFAKFNKDFPNHAVAKPNVIDIGTMAVHRGVTKWKLGATTLQALVKKSLKKFLPKPAEIRVGDVFDDSSKMRDIIQLHCARDAAEYINLPDLSARCRPQQIQI